MTDYGFNFRGTSGYVTDGTNESPVLGEAEPHTYSNGATGAGWNGASSNISDENSSADRRLAGVNFVTPGSDANFVLTLPAAGTYRIAMALGDQVNPIGPFTCEVWDGSGSGTLLATIVSSGSTGGAHHYFDATGVERSSDADWLANNATVDLTFATTTFWLQFHGLGGYAEIAHLRVQDVAGDILMGQAIF